VIKENPSSHQVIPRLIGVLKEADAGNKGFDMHWRREEGLGVVALMSAHAEEFNNS
jgi:hypothetical protein